MMEAIEALLPALEGLPRTYLVGGAVRDLLRGAAPVDLDLVVEGDAREAASVVASRLGGEAVEWERFGTAEVRTPRLPVTVNFTTMRRETYPEPGALPEVEPGSLEEDLARRDFTVNAMAMSLPDEAVIDPHGGRADLEAGVIRVLHERSFVDDPTRLLRALRYEARLGARLDERTEELAREAIAAGALDTVSGKRIRDELLDLLREPEAPAALERMRELRLDCALHPAWRVMPERAASAMLACVEVTGADPALTVLAALMVPDAEALHPLLDRLALTRQERDRVARAAEVGGHLAHRLSADMPDSRVHDLLNCEPAETLAVALAWGAPGTPVLRYHRDLREVQLEVTGDDLVAAGIPESPAVGRALRETLRRKLDGEVSGREEELALALQLARGGRA